MERKDLMKEIWSWTKEIAIILFIVWFIISFVAQNTKVSGHSMEPTLSDGDFLIINKFIYDFAEPAKGDIVVFPHNGDESEIYIKRVIGLPGDEIDIRGGKVYVNEVMLEEDYVSEDIYNTGNIEYPFTVSEDKYFVMGDNRNNSYDSRYLEVGLVPIDEIIGKASIRIWPLNELGLVY
ncbi:signal peptidase I [Vallitalea okinawensis]|uniref:signal peptidase I n=1 Tax=Vallitalea okinawensis TaxID=2078660 RepID=UPI000CFA8EF6|nr:signal peptidase I [Vallitalea okinawensis]